LFGPEGGRSAIIKDSLPRRGPPDRSHRARRRRRAHRGYRLHLSAPPARFVADLERADAARRQVDNVVAETTAAIGGHAIVEHDR
jgi:hypothetical protein